MSLFMTAEEAPVFDGYWRTPVERIVDPFGAKLHSLGVTANVLTAIGVVTAGAAAVVIGSGRLQIGFLLLIVAALPDLLDGPVAKAAGPPSLRGAFYDSTADRVTDTLLLAGVIWYLQRDGGHLGMLGVAIMGTSWLVSYERAKAESLGFDAKGGLMERAERLIALGIGLAIPPMFEPMLWIMLALTLVTAIQRFVKVWKQATLQMVAIDMDRSH